MRGAYRNGKGGEEPALWTPGSELKEEGNYQTIVNGMSERKISFLVVVSLDYVIANEIAQSGAFYARFFPTRVGL